MSMREDLDCQNVVGSKIQLLQPGVLNCLPASSLACAWLCLISGLL